MEFLKSLKQKSLLLISSKSQSLDGLGSVVGSLLNDLVGVDESSILALENASLGLLVDGFVSNAENVIVSESLLALGIGGFHS